MLSPHAERLIRCQGFSDAALTHENRRTASRPSPILVVAVFQNNDEARVEKHSPVGHDYMLRPVKKAAAADNRSGLTSQQGARRLT